MTTRRESTALTSELICEMLRNSRRRAIICYLVTHDGQVGLRTLSEYVARNETDGQSENLCYEHRKRVKNALRQHHLPKMVDGGVIKYDEQRQTVAAVDATVELSRYLSMMEHPSPPWERYYGGVLGVEALALFILSVGPFARLPQATVIWVGLFLCPFSVLVIGHIYVTWRSWIANAERDRWLVKRGHQDN